MHAVEDHNRRQVHAEPGLDWTIASTAADPGFLRALNQNFSFALLTLQRALGGGLLPCDEEATTNYDYSSLDFI